MKIIVRQAETPDIAVVASILQEAAQWLAEKQATLWSADRITIEQIATDVERKMFWLAEVGGEIGGCVRYQQTDEEHWDDVPHADSAFVHRLVVRRAFSGGAVSRFLIDWAKRKARGEGKTFLRLDCADRPALRNFYESCGFVFHSIKEKQPYPVVRYEFKL